MPLDTCKRNVNTKTYAKKVIVIVVLYVDVLIAGFGRQPYSYRNHC